MLDLQRVRDEPEAVARALARRGGASALDGLLAADAERRALLAESERLKGFRNTTSKRIGEILAAKGPADELRAEVKAAGARIAELEARLAAVERELERGLGELPNLPHASVPDGATAEHNVVVRSWGEPPRTEFEPLPHWELGTRLGILDFERAAKVAGARFATLVGDGARLERALIQFMLDLHTREHGYLEVLPPYLVNAAALYGTGQLPKFEQDLFRVEPGGYYLIPTAEVPVTNLHADEILAGESLPRAYCAFTPCFRSEAGSYGQDVRGLIRQHQFHKVELVRFATAEESYAELERLTAHAESVLQRLGLHYRVVALCAGDLGFASAKTYDLEVWLPAQRVYREISSCSNFEEFQARRAKIRYRPAGGGKARPVHTLNGSGLAIGRTLVALLENYQRADGTVEVPVALRPYLHGAEALRPQTALGRDG